MNSVNTDQPPAPPPAVAVMLLALCSAPLTSAVAAGCYTRGTTAVYGAVWRQYEQRADSPVLCATACSTHWDCRGFTSLQNGTCRLFSQLSATPGTGSVAVAYPDPPVTPCPDGWQIYRHSCYYVGWESMTWTEANAACESRYGGAALASLNDEREAQYWVGKKTSSARHIGLRKTSDGSLINLDGTSLSFPLEFLQEATSGCFNLVTANRPHLIYLRSCGDLLPGYLCEGPVQHQPLIPNWLAIDGFYYYYTTTPRTWQAADEHCASLAAGARLAVIPDLHTWRLLQMHYAGVPVWIGLRDVDGQGVWRNLDGGGVPLRWSASEPSGGGAAERCAAGVSDGASARDCGLGYPALCRRPSVRRC